MSHPPVIAAPPALGADALRLLTRADHGPLREAACASRRIVCDTWCGDRAPATPPAGRTGDAFALAINYADWLRKANRESPLPGFRLGPAGHPGMGTPDAMRTNAPEHPDPMLHGPDPVAPAHVSENTPKIGDVSPTRPPPPLRKVLVVTERRVLSAVGRMIDVIA